MFVPPSTPKEHEVQRHKYGFSICMSMSNLWLSVDDVSPIVSYGAGWLDALPSGEVTPNYKVSYCDYSSACAM